MKTILVLSPHPDFAETIRAGLNPEQYRVVHRLSVEEAEPLLVHGLADACILDVDLMGVEGVWVIERLRRRDAKTPIIAYTANTQSEWEEEAFLRGVTHVLTKPVRGRLLNSLLDRLWNAPATRAAPAPLPSRKPVFPHGRTVAQPRHQRVTNARRAARFFVHPDPFAGCRGDVEAIPAVPPRNSQRQPRRHFPEPSRPPLTETLFAGGPPPAARRRRHRPFVGPARTF